MSTSEKSKQLSTRRQVNLYPENLVDFPYGAILAHSYQRELMIDFKNDIVKVAVKHPPLFCRTVFYMLSQEIEAAVCSCLICRIHGWKKMVLSSGHRKAWFRRGPQGWPKSYHNIYTQMFWAIIQIWSWLFKWVSEKTIKLFDKGQEER